jgi:hypothetical protein
MVVMPDGNAWHRATVMQVISRNTADAETRQVAAAEKEEALQKESAAIAIEKVDAEQALSEAIPALEEAAAALNDLKRDDITEIRSFAKPHILVQKVRLHWNAQLQLGVVSAHINLTIQDKCSNLALAPFNILWLCITGRSQAKHRQNTETSLQHLNTQDHQSCLTNPT